MSPLERLRWAVAPVQQRSLALLWGGFALFMVSGALPLLVPIAMAPKVLLYAGMFTGWAIAAAGMTGYLRCLWGAASTEMRRVQAGRMQDEEKK